MIGYTESPLAWGMTRGIARALGVDLPSAVVEGWLTRAELAKIVGRCAQCHQKVVCTAWLARSGDGSAPGFCPNLTEIEALRLRH